MSIDDPLGEPPAARRTEAALQPTMHGLGALLITLSCLSPSIGVFLVGSDVIRQAGTSAFICFVAAALLGVAMAMVYAELSSAFPGAGGEYTILGRALGRRWGIVALGINLLGFSLAQSISGLGVATYLRPLAPGLPAVPTAMVLVAIVTLVAILNIRVNAWITGLFLAAEISALTVLALIGLLHPSRSFEATVLHPVMLGPHGLLQTPSLIVVGVAMAGGVYAFNGYGAVVFLGEEMHEAPRIIARVVFLALSLAALTELPPLLSVLMGAPDLQAVLASDTPIPTFIAASVPPWLGVVMSLGVALAVFNAMIAVALIGGRQLYATGRDRLWPDQISRLLARIHPQFRSPWIATLVMGAMGFVGCLAPAKALVLILGNGNIALYAGLCAATVTGRRSGATSRAGWRMPLYPLPPAAALVALAAVVWFDLHDADGAKGLAATVGTVVLSLLYYTVVLKRREAWSYGRTEPSNEGVQALDVAEDGEPPV